MAKDKKLTPAEWELMEVIWDLGGAPSIREVLEKAFPNGEKAYTTVQTIMNILVKKGWLKTKKIGLVNFYQPIRSRDQVIQVETKSFVSQVFNGSVPALANYLLNSDAVGLNEIKEIKAMLAKKEAQLKGKSDDQ